MRSFVPPRTQHENPYERYKVGRRLRLSVFATTGVAEFQELRCHNGKDGDSRFEAGATGKLQALDATPRLHGLVKFLNGPAARVPINSLPSIAFIDDRDIGQKDPFHRLAAGRRIRLPNTNNPDVERRLVVVPSCLTRWQDLQRAPGHRQLGLASAWPAWAGTDTVRRIVLQGV